MIKSCPYFGSLLGFVVFSYVSDNIGRKKTIVTSLGISTVGSLLVVTGFNLPMIAVGVIMSGAGINVALSMALCFMGEVIDNYKRQKYSILMQSGYTIGCMIMTGLYYFLGNWRIVTVIIQAVPITLTFLTFTFYAEETPFFLLRGKTSEALKSLNRIGKINFKIQDILTEEDIESVKRELITKTPEQGNRVSPWDLMRFRSLRTTTLLTSVLGFVILSMYYGPALSIGSIGFNTYVTNIAILFSDLIGIIPCYYYIDKVQRRMTGLAMFSVTLVCSFILLFVEKQEKCELCT
jgi:OCT family organic cation transporter-like MFS transporter 4/5